MLAIGNKGGDIIHSYARTMTTLCPIQIKGGGHTTKQSMLSLSCANREDSPKNNENYPITVVHQYWLSNVNILFRYILRDVIIIVAKGQPCMLTIGAVINYLR